jgi:hypothetical protein
MIEHNMLRADYQASVRNGDESSWRLEIEVKLRAIVREKKVKKLGTMHKRPGLRN